MTPAVTALLAEFESAAKSAQVAEAELRKAMAEQIGRLERQRAFAFRRTRLIRTLAVTVPAEATEPDAVWSAQQQAVREELGWTSASESYDAILAQLQPVGGAVRECLCTPDAALPALVSERLVAFETWFESEHGKSFYVLFDQYVQENPVVDF